MTPRDFCYWLQGYIEVHGEPPNREQWQKVKNHLGLVFKHIDEPDPTGELQAVHDGGPHPIPGFSGNGYMMKQTCSVCHTDWWECPHGKDQPRPRC